MRNLMITGGAGFIGSNFVRHILRSGSGRDVTVLDKLTYAGHLESLPEPGTSLLIAGYPVEVVQIQDNAVKTARIRPTERRPFAEQD